MIAAAIVLAIAASTAQARVEAIRDRFVAELRRCGRTPPTEPAMVADTSPGLIFYSDRDRSVHYPEWKTIGEDARAMLAAAAARAPRRPSAKAYFEDVFQSLLVPHELGHMLEDLGGQTLSWWDSEFRANRIALAYWRLRTPDAALHRRLIDYWGIGGMTSPVPAGQDVATFFNASKFDPKTYGWYQGEMMRRAWDRRDEADFCTLVREQWPTAAPVQRPR